LQPISKSKSLIHSLRPSAVHGSRCIRREVLKQSGNSSAEGTLAFTVLSPGNYRIEVLAPGFAPVKLDVRVPREASAKVQLKVAGPEQTVVVTATRTAVTEQDAGIPVAVLDQPELKNSNQFPRPMRCAFCRAQS
jgi:outer membrane receptor protein involved in Fe transport